MHHSTKKDTELFKFGHSHDPDDAFMFYAMAENKFDLHGYRFDQRLEDIQTLNERARRGELHISAISIHAYAYVLDKYALLPTGASMGDGYGPMIIARSDARVPQAGDLEAIRVWLRDHKIAVPGKMTSAYLALQLFMGASPHTALVPFDEIFEFVQGGLSQGGLIIHEGQLTYEREGFRKILDLGEWWKAETGLPL